MPEFFKGLPHNDLSIPHRSSERTANGIPEHVTNDERIYTYRTLRFARNDPTELASFDQEVVATHSEANERSLAGLLDEYIMVRAAKPSLFGGLPQSALTRVGIANGSWMSVLAAAFHTAGHELHRPARIRVNYGRKVTP